MEVREIVETIVREPVLEVRFRMDVDGDDVPRWSWCLCWCWRWRRR